LESLDGQGSFSGARDFSRLYLIQSGFGVHPALGTLGTEGVVLGGVGVVAGVLTSSSAEVGSGFISSLSHMPACRGA
jgi:hypothetical protein